MTQAVANEDLKEVNTYQNSKSKQKTYSDVSRHALSKEIDGTLAQLKKTKETRNSRSK